MQVNILSKEEFLLAEVEEEIEVKELKFDNKKVYINIISYHARKIMENIFRKNISEKLEESDIIITEVHSEIKKIKDSGEIYYCDYYYGEKGIEEIILMKIKDIRDLEFTKNPCEALKILEKNEYAILIIDGIKILLNLPKNEKEIKAKLLQI